MTPAMAQRGKKTNRLVYDLIFVKAKSSRNTVVGFEKNTESLLENAFPNEISYTAIEPKRPPSPNADNRAET